MCACPNNEVFCTFHEIKSQQRNFQANTLCVVSNKAEIEALQFNVGFVNMRDVKLIEFQKVGFEREMMFFFLMRRQETEQEGTISRCCQELPRVPISSGPGEIDGPENSGRDSIV